MGSESISKNSLCKYNCRNTFVGIAFLGITTDSYGFLWITRDYYGFLGLLGTSYGFLGITGDSCRLEHKRYQHHMNTKRDLALPSRNV